MSRWTVAVGECSFSASQSSDCRREAVRGKICLVPSGVRSEKRRPSPNHPRLWTTFLFAEASDTTLITGARGISSDLMLWRPDADVFHLGRQS